MSYRVRTRSIIVLLATTGALCVLAMTAVADTTRAVTPTSEGWYQPNPSCTSALGCTTPVSPPTPFPPRTLHVGYVAGHETARSYLALPIADVTGAITSARLTIPLDTASTDGSVQPETSKLQICLVRGAIKAVDGSTDAPPPVDCAAAARVTYVTSPSPRLQADLEPLLGELPTVAGLVLLPDATKVAPSDAWRVVFSAHDRTDAGKTEPASLVMTLGDAKPDESFDDGAPVAGPDDSVAEGAAASIDNGTVFALGPAPPPQTAVSSFGAPDTIASATGTPVSVAATVTVGYAYPVVLLLPLGLLILLPLAARALTQEL